MVTTFPVDDELAHEFRDAVRLVYPHAYGKIKDEIKIALKERIKVLKAQKNNPPLYDPEA